MKDFYGLGLWYINLRFSICQGNVNLATLHLLAVRAIEDVANSGAFVPWSCWGERNLIVLVCDCNHKVTSVEAVHIVKHILLLKLVVPDAVLFPCLVDGSSHLVDI